MEDNKNIVIEEPEEPEEPHNEPIEPRNWDTCCSHSSKDFIKYITTVSMSVIVLIFCIVMIYSNPENDNSIYFALLSSIISIYIPNPKLENEK